MDIPLCLFSILRPTQLFDFLLNPLCPFLCFVPALQRFMCPKQSLWKCIEQNVKSTAGARWLLLGAKVNMSYIAPVKNNFLCLG